MRAVILHLLALTASAHQIVASRGRTSVRLRGAPAPSLADEEARITLVGAGLNVCLAGVKAAVGVACGSSVLVADAAHSASDLVSDGVALAAVRAAKTQTPRYPAGCAKAGALGALGIGGMLATGGGALAWTQVAAIRAPRLVLVAPPGLAASAPAALAALASVVSKEWLARATERVGRKHRSPAVVANAAHHRSDALSSLVALVGILGARAAAVLDPVAGLVVAAFVVRMGVEITGDALLELTDAADAGTADAVERALAGLGVSAVRATAGGAVDVELRAPRDATARDVRTLATVARRRARRAAPGSQIRLLWPDAPPPRRRRRAFPKLAPLAPGPPIGERPVWIKIPAGYLTVARPPAVAATVTALYSAPAAP